MVNDIAIKIKQYETIIA